MHYDSWTGRLDSPSDAGSFWIQSSRLLWLSARRPGESGLNLGALITRIGLRGRLYYDRVWGYNIL